MALALSGDINLKLGSVTRHQISNPNFEAFSSTGHHFIHLRINSLLPKIDESRNIAKYFYAAVIGITETKLGNTVYDSEVTIDRHRIVQNDKNRKGGCVSCYTRSKICYSRKTYLSNNLENILIDLLFPKSKRISISIIYKPPSQTRFLEQMITEFVGLELNGKLYIFGDFSINVMFKHKSIINKTQKNHCKESATETIKHSEFNKCNEIKYNTMFNILF